LLSYGTRRTAKSFPGDGKRGIRVIGHLSFSSPYGRLSFSAGCGLCFLPGIPYFDYFLNGKGSSPNWGFSN